MNFQVLTAHKLFKPALGALLTVLCGLALWTMPLGEPWENVSYDYLFRFSARAVTNNVVLIHMDNDAFDYFKQDRREPWDRALHAKLLNVLADDNCPLVVFDSIFKKPGNPARDKELAEALKRQRRVVLMAEQVGATYLNVDTVRPTLPIEPFLTSANTNWGVAWFDADFDFIVRRHWPFPAPHEGLPSLPWTTALLAEARLEPTPQEMWLRYYGPTGPWKSMGYRVATNQPKNYFSDKIVFIGNKPRTPVPDGETDEFRTPYTRWTRDAVGGVELNATAFLNLMNGDWLRRPPSWLEAFILGASGLLLGGGLWYARPLPACALAGGAALGITLGAVSFSYFTNYWFPWAIIAGGQVPCALVWSLVGSRVRLAPQHRPTIRIEPPPERPEAPDYQLFDLPFGHGAYGKVWLARNAIGQWQALKAIYLNKFGDHPEPYEREFTGISKYKPVSDKHPGLLRVDFVSTKKPEGYFYYVMELGDALTPGWEQDPATYTPLDLARARAQIQRKRLPARECVRIALTLAQALDFLHFQGLIHRDIKPQNVIFVNGTPKLADIGLVSDIAPAGQEPTWVGTPGYMPPPPEPPGTVQADIYGLGMVLYVICTGKDPGLFPEISTSLVAGSQDEDFMALNAVVLKACHPNRALRYATAAEFAAALAKVQTKLAGVMPA